MYPSIKRFFDFLASAVVLLLLLPIFLPIAMLLRLTGEGAVIYLQERVGLKNKIFNIWKFATMLKNSPNLGTGDVTLKEDPRVLPMGKFLRKTKINELPQLVNILRGDMSIVGARPLMKVSFDSYNNQVKSLIYNTRPGLTGIGSVVFRDEESLIDQSDIPPREFYEKYIIPHKGELEIWYQKNISFGTDLLIISLTVWVILFSKSQLVYRIFPSLPKRHF